MNRILPFTGLLVLTITGASTLVHAQQRTLRPIVPTAQALASQGFTQPPDPGVLSETFGNLKGQLIRPGAERGLPELTPRAAERAPASAIQECTIIEVPVDSTFDMRMRKSGDASATFTMRVIELPCHGRTVTRQPPPSQQTPAR